MLTPRILYVVSHWPGAPPYGAQQRVLQIGRLLKKIGSVSLVVLDVNGEGESWKSKTAAEFNIVRVVQVQSVAQKSLLSRLRHELDSRYLHTVPSTVTFTERQAVLDLTNEHDVIWVHTIRTANVLGIYGWPNSVLDLDDIPSRLYESSARVCTSVARRLLDRRMSLIWRRRERRLAERFNVLMVCSEDDRRFLGMDRVRVLSNGFQRVLNINRCPSHPPRIGFIGTFKWQPNLDGVRWFCAQIWPKIKDQVPDSRLRIIGEGTEGANGWGADVEGVGRVQDAGLEIATWSTMIVPIRVGGGTRIKVLEGFARKCPVVATSVGAFGYDIRDGEEAFLADEPQLFALRCVELIKSPQVAANMVERAYHRFLRCWTWESYEGTVRSAIECATR